MSRRKPENYKLAKVKCQSPECRQKVPNRRGGERVEYCNACIEEIEQRKVTIRQNMVHRADKGSKKHKREYEPHVYRLALPHR